MASRTRRNVSAATEPGAFNTRDTVMGATPASLASSVIRTWPVPRRPRRPSVFAGGNVRIPSKILPPHHGFTLVMVALSKALANGWREVSGDLLAVEPFRGEKTGRAGSRI